MQGKRILEHGLVFDFGQMDSKMGYTIEGEDTHQDQMVSVLLLLEMEQSNSERR